MAEQNTQQVPTFTQESQALRELKKSVQEISGVQDHQIGTDILEPQTHKRKRRRLHKKKVRRHSPQYYEEKRQKKIQKKRELNWDSHFINEAIPDIMQRKRPKTRLDNKKQFQRYKISKQQLLHPALSLKKGTKLPQIQKKSQTTKSFKIRVVNKKGESNIDEKLDVYEKKDNKNMLKIQKQTPKQRQSVKKMTQDLVLPAKYNTVNIQKTLESKQGKSQLKAEVQQIKNQKSNTQEKKKNIQQKAINQDSEKNQSGFEISKVQQKKPQQSNKQVKEQTVKTNQKNSHALKSEKKNSKQSQERVQAQKQKSSNVTQKPQVRKQTTLIKSTKVVQPIVKKQDESSKRQIKQQPKIDAVKKQLKTQKKYDKTQREAIAGSSKDTPQNTANISKVSKRQTKQQALAKLYRQKMQVIQKSLTTEQQFPPCHKQLLQSFFPFLQNKKVKTALDHELQEIKNRRSLISTIKRSVQNRERQMGKIKEALQANVQPSKLPFLIVDDYRTATLICIEDILKWKQHWQGMYKELTKKSKTFEYLYKNQKYLLKIISSVDFIFKDQINKKDPFLISLYGLNQQQKQITLKIRACELLLLEEQFSCLGQNS